MNKQRRAFFLAHGGGPMPLLADDEHHKEMVAALQEIANTIETPKKIILVSAHWEADIATLTSGAQPELIYDYGGFPAEAYSIEYACSGDPELSSNIAEQLNLAGIDVKQDASRGFDHGMFVPLKIMYPDADIPCVQLSLLNNLDPLAHIQLGQALQSLDDESVLLIGSGFSFHNMRAFFTPDDEESNAKNQAFERWLMETCSSSNLSEKEREQRLVEWANAPAARYCHPREEHLLPLHVCYGFAGTACAETYSIRILNKAASMFVWDVRS